MISNHLKPADAGQGTGASADVDDGSRARGASRRRERGSDFSAMLRGLGADPSRSATDRTRGQAAAGDRVGADGDPAGQTAARRLKTRESVAEAGDEAVGVADWTRPTQDLATPARTAGRGREKAEAGAATLDLDQAGADAAGNGQRGAAKTIAEGIDDARSDRPAPVAGGDPRPLLTDEGRASRRGSGDAIAAAVGRDPKARTVPGAEAGQRDSRVASDQPSADRAVFDGVGGGRRRDDLLAGEQADIDRPIGGRHGAGRATAGTVTTEMTTAAGATATVAAGVAGRAGANGARAAATATAVTAVTAATVAATASATAAATVAAAATEARTGDVERTAGDLVADRDEGIRKEAVSTTRRQSAFQARLAAADTPVSDPRSVAGDPPVRATSTVELASTDGSALRALAERERATGVSPHQARAQDVTLHLPSTPTPGAAAPTGIPTVVLAPALNDPAFAQALGQQVRLLVNGEIKVADMVVTPPEMGPVRIELSVRGDSADVVFTAAAPETLKAIEASGEVLRSMLAERGISLGSMDVGQGQPQSSNLAQGDGASHRQHAPGRAETTGQGGPGSESTAHTPVTTTHRRGIVDLFA